MIDTVLKSIERRLTSYNEVIDGITAEQLAQEIDLPRHKSLLVHLWCVIGARESYTRALRSGKWEGFESSMVEYSHQEFRDKLRSSAEELLSVASGMDEWTPERERLLLELSDHEVMHEGQMIRHMYALEMEIPKSVKWA